MEKFLDSWGLTFYTACPQKRQIEWDENMVYSWTKTFWRLLLFVLHDEINFSEVGVLKIKLLELFTVYLSFVNLKETKTLIVRSLLVINVFRNM